jgi:hypothetical protein
VEAVDQLVPDRRYCNWSDFIPEFASLAVAAMAIELGEAVLNDKTAELS